MNRTLIKLFKPFALVGVIVMLALVFNACDKSGAQFQKKVTEADALFEDQKYDEALKLYEAAKQLKPEEEHPNQRINEILEIKRIEAERIAEENYYLEIEKADEYFYQKDYQAAKNAYLNAANFKPGEQYPIDKIAEIDQLLGLNTQPKAINSDLVYHVVVGSFTQKANAEELLQRLKNEGQSGRLVSRYNGEYTAVIVASFATIHEAYNHLSDAKKYADQPWVIHKRFK